MGEQIKVVGESNPKDLLMETIRNNSANQKPGDAVKLAQANDYFQKAIEFGTKGKQIYMEAHGITIDTEDVPYALSQPGLFATEGNSKYISVMRCINDQIAHAKSKSAAANPDLSLD